MPSKIKKVSLIVFVVLTLLAVGLIPLGLTGWFLSDKSARELRSAENRYQIQLVQEKARQIEMFGRQYSSLVENIGAGFELSEDTGVLASEKTERRLGTLLRDNPDVISLYVKPENADSLTVFRSEAASKDQVEALSADSPVGAKAGSVAIGEPQSLNNSADQVITFTVEAVPDVSPRVKVVAVVSLKDISKHIVGTTANNEEELWRSGLPIVFVIDQKGKAFFHPDQTIAAAHRPMTGLRIVDEWLESGSQVRSALVPFTAKFAENEHEMIGAYSTALVSPENTFGVITMQDERTALASVGEMRTQMRIIILAFAIFTLVVGLILSRLMTAPLLNLVVAAKSIAAGNFSSRVDSRNITEIGTLGESFNMMADTVEEQIAKLAKAAAENRELFEGTVKALAAAIDGKDKYTRGHSERVARISVAIGKRLGIVGEELDTLRISALLHDIGKIGIDDSILKKPAALTDEEYEIMKTHPQRGYKIMSQIPAMKDFLPGMYMHHEMVNGKGYPQGLVDHQIPLQAKIVSVADTFDAMTIDRPYSTGMELAVALEQIRELVGIRYDHNVVEALVEACDAGEVANGIVRQMAGKRAAAAQAVEEGEYEVVSTIKLVA